MERCRQFNTPNLEEQRDKLIKKYGDNVKDAKIITQEDGSRVFVASRRDQVTGEDVKYAYFDTLAACNSYQDQVFKVHLQEQRITKQDTNGEANDIVKATARHENGQKKSETNYKDERTQGEIAFFVIFFIIGFTFLLYTLYFLYIVHNATKKSENARHQGRILR